MSQASREICLSSLHALSSGSLNVDAGVAQCRSVRVRSSEQACKSTCPGQWNCIQNK